MQDATFKVGDTVRLKSGGPIMTITAVDRPYDTDLQAFCTWFKSDNGTTSQYFPLPAIVVVDER